MKMEQCDILSLSFLLGGVVGVDGGHEQTFDLRQSKRFFRKGVELVFGQNLCQRLHAFDGRAAGDEAVRPLADYFKIPPERVLVVSDEVALVPGRLRMRASGSAGGHNGLKNIILHLGTENFPRLRVGVGSPPHPDYDMADWVMGVPRGEDAAALEKAEERAADAIECCVQQGIDRAMNRYNG